MFAHLVPRSWPVLGRLWRLWDARPSLEDLGYYGQAFVHCYLPLLLVLCFLIFHDVGSCLHTPPPPPGSPACLLYRGSPYPRNCEPKQSIPLLRCFCWVLGHNKKGNSCTIAPRRLFFQPSALWRRKKSLPLPIKECQAAGADVGIAKTSRMAISKELRSTIGSDLQQMILSYMCVYICVHM